MTHHRPEPGRRKDQSNQGERAEQTPTTLLATNPPFGKQLGNPKQPKCQTRALVASERRSNGEGSPSHHGWGPAAPATKGQARCLLMDDALGHLSRQGCRKCETRNRGMQNTPPLMHVGLQMLFGPFSLAAVSRTNCHRGCLRDRAHPKSTRFVKLGAAKTGVATSERHDKGSRSCIVTAPHRA